ncbi:MAG: hypothetical protein GY769_04895 [bacterium]|nr:hypothetical protein [bacterium]
MFIPPSLSFSRAGNIRQLLAPARQAGSPAGESLAAAGVGYTIAHRHQLWWSPRDSEQRPLWNSVVVLSSEFYDELVAHAVPIDLRALKALKGSPLALDIYSWLTYRMSYLRKPCLIPWEALQIQFGADYGRLRDFKRKFLTHLSDVLTVYPAARISEQVTGLLLRASPTHLPRR